MPLSKGNRGMGLPAPFMGLLRMLEGIPVGSSNFGKQIEYMYVNGYDFRQFIVTSIPMSIMEVLMRVFYVAKQVSLGKGAFGGDLTGYHAVAAKSTLPDDACPGLWNFQCC